MNKILSFLFFILSSAASFSQGNSDIERIFDGDYFGYKSKVNFRQIFPCIIRQSVNDFNKWGFAEVNVNTKKLTKYDYDNPVEQYKKTLNPKEFDNEYPHAWGVINKEGRFVVSPVFKKLIIFKTIRDVKYSFLVSADANKGFLLNRTIGELVQMPDNAMLSLCKPINQDYFIYSISEEKGNSQPGKLRSGVMNYSGKVIIDPVNFSLQYAGSEDNHLFIATKSNGKKDILRFTNMDPTVINLTNEYYSEIIPAEGSSFFRLVAGKDTVIMSPSGKIINKNEVALENKKQAQSDFEKRLTEGGLSESEFRKFYDNNLKGILHTLCAEVDEGYGVVSVWSSTASCMFSINNGTFGTSGESRMIEKSNFWSGCNCTFPRRYPDLKKYSSTAMVVVPYGTYKVQVYDMYYGAERFNSTTKERTTQVTTVTKTYTVTVSPQKPCAEVRID
ncbi:MAG: hypothetical protein AB9842_01025 [Bacteroidales bacterium]